MATLDQFTVEIYDDQVLGVGVYGKVYKAKYGQLPCAAKIFNNTLLYPAISMNTTRFEKECKFLSTIKHPNIVQYLGGFRDPKSHELALLMELMDESLTKFLKRSTSTLSYQIQLNICHDVALALSYLHSNSIIHGNLSSNNVLLSPQSREGIRTKVTGIGMIMLVDMSLLTTQATAYKPPESFTTPPQYSYKQDCFSHGVLTIQILTRNFPKPGTDVQCVKDPYYRGKILVKVPETERRKKDIDLIEPNHPLLSVALHCLHDNATERPSANEVSEKIAALKREEIESSEESQKFCANVKKHLENSGAINRFLAHIVFVGLPGSGKTTLILRLLSLSGVKKMLRLKALCSTGVMNGIVSVNVVEDKASLYAASIDQDCEWHEVQFGLSCLRQMGIQCFELNEAPECCDLPRTSPLNLEAAKVSVNASKSQNVEAQKMLDEEAQLSDAKPNIPHFTTTDTVQQSPDGDVMATIQRLLEIQGYSAVLPFLENKTTLYLSDTGGQIEFQELLPLLVALHAIFVFLFPLNVDLDAPVTVSYRKKVGDEVKHSNVYTSSLTIRESFLQTLASIDSKDDDVNPSVAKHKPYVFVVGTHKDCLINELGEVKAREKIAEIDREIKILVKDHQYEDMVVYADKVKDEVLFAVDNTCENDVFPKIRRSIFDFIHSSNEFRIQFPLSYLLASLHLQNSSKPFVKRSEFAHEVLQYGIEEEDVDHLLQFLHTRIGQIRYFPLEEIKEVIVKEPQALYNLVTCLITKSFISRTVTMKTNTEVQKGIYSFESFCNKEFFSQSDFLTPKHIILLLKELRIVAPFFDRNAEVEKYFIPCVLNHLVEAPDDNSCKMSAVQPLTITFDCGHCPKGLFGVLLHYLVTHQNKKLNWNLDINKIFRDRVSFEVGCYEDEVTVKFHSTYLDVSCYPAIIEGRSQAFSLKKLCNMIRCTLASGIEKATESLHYSEKKAQHSLGLMCIDCNKSHKVTEIDSQYVIWCSQQKCRSIHESDPGSYWFGAPPIVSFPSLATNNVISLKEHSNGKLEFKVTSDPTLDSHCEHVVKKKEGSSCKDCVYIDRNEIIFKKVWKSDAGIYTVTTSNAAGEGQASFQLDIKIPPKYSLETDYLEAEAGSSPTLTFTVTSDPPLAEDTEHALNKSDGTKVTRRFKVERSHIIFRNVRVEDSGEYTISCCSEEGEVGQATLELEVTPTQPLHSTQKLVYSSNTSTGRVVKSEDVNMLMDHLHKHSYKWREIGASLNFQYGELENISASNPRAATSHFLTVLLNQWSQWPTTHHSDLPTMEKLCDALRNDRVGLGAVADTLRRHFVL